MNTKLERADAAWGRLANDLHEVGGVSDAAIERGKIAVRRGLPWAIGAAVLVFSLLGVKWMRRRRRRRPAFELERRPSLFAEMARIALLSGVGAVSRRLALRAPLPRLTAARQTRQSDGTSSQEH